MSRGKKQSHIEEFLERQMLMSRALFAAITYNVRDDFGDRRWLLRMPSLSATVRLPTRDGVEFRKGKRGGNLS